MQKRLYAVFYALDVSAAAFTEGANAAIHAASDATLAARAARAATAATAAHGGITLVDDDVALVAHDIFASNNMNIQSRMLQDLDIVQNKRGVNKRELTDFYGKFWDNFQKALEAEGCAYWGQLYKRVFENGLVMEPEDLEKRLNIPNEIREQGLAAVANYLEELEKGATRLNEARIIILGDKGAGKTCIARRLINPEAPMTTDYESTAGVNTMLWKLEDENINVRIWDFAGHTVTHAVHQFFLSERCLYLLVYDGRTEKRNRLEYWLNHMNNYDMGIQKPLFWLINATNIVWIFQ
jgi:hypothetical protein